MPVMEKPNRQTVHLIIEAQYVVNETAALVLMDKLGASLRACIDGGLLTEHVEGWKMTICKVEHEEASNGFASGESEKGR